jgi:WD40 repeat protein
VELVDADSGKSICKINASPGVDGRGPRKTFAASPDGRHFLVDVAKQISENTSLREFHIHDGESGRLQCKLDCKETDQQLVDVSFSPDGRTLATVFDERRYHGPDQLPITQNDVVLWNVETGAKCAILRGHKSRVRIIAFSPDGKKLLSGEYSGMIRIWDVEAMKEQIAIQAHKSAIRSACLSGDGSMIASTSQDNADVELWNTRTGQEILSLSLAEDPAALVRIVARDKALLTVSASGILRSWPIDPLGHMHQRGFRPLFEDERRQFGIAGDASN